MTRSWTSLVSRWYKDGFDTIRPCQQTFSIDIRVHSMGKTKSGECGAVSSRKVRGEAKGKGHNRKVPSTVHAQTIGSPETNDPIFLLYLLCSCPTLSIRLRRPFPTPISHQPCQTAEYVGRTTPASSADAPGRPAMAMR